MCFGMTIKLSRYLFTGIMIASLLQGCSHFYSHAGGEKDLIPNATPFLAYTKAPPPTTEVLQITPLKLDTYLTNPGMGWQDDPQSVTSMNIPETVSYSDRQKIGWAKLNPAEGVYDWSSLDAQLNQAIRDGKQFSFRIYTYVGEEYGGNMVPAWVRAKGARFLPSGEPDYSSCAYQEAWGEFVDELIRVYDGNPNIAFIDISGYGNFNEWSWQGAQTEWDQQWANDYENGTPSAASFQTLDGQARRRLVDAFIGGSFDGHQCRAQNGEIILVNYSYPGFRKTQLLMPYAGILQSTQYAYSRRTDIGFRHDCLGRDGAALYDKVGFQINKIWKNAPVVYELCRPNEVDLEGAGRLLQMTHASIVHNNSSHYPQEQLEEMLSEVGYRYFLKSADLSVGGRSVDIAMEWQNTGFAPSYPRMGQDFRLYFDLVDRSGLPVFRELIPADISAWQPAAASQTEPPGYRISHRFQIPSSVLDGTYQAGLTILDLRTGKPIHLSFEGGNKNGVYILSPITIQ
jgi:hypothetical protein